MSRVQLALNVDDIDAAVDFYSTLFDTAPAKRRPGYANFAVANPPLKLVLFENPGQSGTLNHVGVERESMEEVEQEADRLEKAGLALRVEGTSCAATPARTSTGSPDPTVSSGRTTSSSPTPGRSSRERPAPTFRWRSPEAAAPEVLPTRRTPVVQLTYFVRPS